MKKLQKKKGILLDFGCGKKKQGPHWIGMDKRKLPSVDIVHDLEKIPYPFKDESVLTTVASHVLEHLDPRLTVAIFNEIWRITVPGGQFVIATPFAGSREYWKDPTHCNGFTEETFTYFDPEANSVLYNVYRPKPWKIEKLYWHPDGFIECVLAKRRENEAK